MRPSESIRAMIMSKDWDGLYNLFDGMPNSTFRKVETLMRQSILPRLGNDDFWSTYHHLLAYRKQSFLPCMSAVRHLALDNQLRFDTDAALAFSSFVKSMAGTSLSIKIARIGLPALATEEQVYGMFGMLGIENMETRASVLLTMTSAMTFHVLFDTLRHADEPSELAYRCCKRLMMNNDTLSYNMVAILRAYFGIDRLTSTLSLKIAPYELSYIDASYENFLNVLTGKKPKV